MNRRCYLDHNATTPVRPEVIEAMIPYLSDHYGNASSVHTFGRKAKLALDESRAKIAQCIGADPDEVYFTGCGTESDNMALAGYFALAPHERRGLVTSSVEHSAILKTARELETRGFPATLIGVDSRCLVDTDALRDAVGSGTALVSIMHANNETGVVLDIREAAAIAHAAGALFHTDAIQSVGKISIDVHDMEIDLLSLSAHKINALKGVGALYVRRGVKIKPLTFGGGHEHGLRPGTENIPGIVGFARALELKVREREEEAAKLSNLRDRLETGIEERISGVLFNGRNAARLPGTANVSFPGVDGEALLVSMDIEGIAISTGSACSSGKVEPSHVLMAMGIPANVAQSSIRFSLGWGTTADDIEYVLEVLPRVVAKLRSVSGVTHAEQL